jgi:hypothetical protein
MFEGESSAALLASMIVDIAPFEIDSLDIELLMGSL